MLLGLGGLPVRNDKKISGLALDSRKVVGGELFLAVPGIVSDGRRFIDQACRQGAAAVLAEADAEYEYLSDLSVIEAPVIFVKGLKEKVGFLISRYYSPLVDKVKVFGFTGTNGKTSCCWFLSQILSYVGNSCAVIGTLGKGMPDALDPLQNTTPDVLTTHEFIASLAGKERPCLAMEVSSHGLSQGRVDGVKFEVGVFTNISRDHLDSYDGMAEYAAAKSLLFSNHSLRYAVINKDDTYASMMQAACSDGVEIITWSQIDASADVYASNIRIFEGGISAFIHTPWGKGDIYAPVMGRFNLENLLAVIAVMGLQGYSLAQITPVFLGLNPVPGRMQQLGGGERPLVLVDYAHTPDALTSVLNTLREHGGRKLVCVIGCGGDRDKGKRALMAAAALSGADSVILTSDNPRTEEPEAIISDMMKGVSLDVRRRVTIIVNRAKAIAMAIAGSSADDCIVIAGKGHEGYQEVNGVRYPFDDCAKVQAALTQWGAS